MSWRDEWLDVTPTGANGEIWKYNALPVHGNGAGGHMIWSTGGGCIGHGKQGATFAQMGQGNGVRKIHVIDIDENSEEVYQYLAYAILYSHQNNERTFVEGSSDGLLGKQAICNWLKRHEYQDILKGFKGQLDRWRPSNRISIFRWFPKIR